MSNVEFRAKGTRGEIWLYDQVGASWFGDGITAKQFQKELSALGKVNTISLHINSPGGDVFDGFAIFNQLKQHPARIEVSIDGLAASIASIIAMSGDEIAIAANAMMMVHDPHGFTAGTADDMDRTAALLRQIKGNLAQTYVDRTKNERAEVEGWMSDETWMTAESAVQLGFADRVTEELPVMACFNLTGFRRVPKALVARLQAQQQSTPARDMRAVQLAVNARRIADLCG